MTRKRRRKREPVGGRLRHSQQQPGKAGHPESGTGRGKVGHSAMTKAIVPVIAAVVLAGTPFMVGKYIEFNRPGPFDSPGYVYSAQHILNGAVLGVDERASAQPGTLLLNIIGVKLFGFNETGPKLIQACLQAGALVLMFFTVGKLFGSLAAVVSVTVAATYLSAPVIAKFGNVKEQYMIAFAVAAACCFALYQIRGRWWLAMLAGAAAINTCYFKATGSAVIIAMGLYLAVRLLFGHGSARRCVIDIVLLMAGAVVGLGPVGLFYLQQGRLDAFFQTFPFLAITIVAPVAVVILVVAFLVGLCLRYRPWRRLREVRRWIWIAGLSAIALALVCSVCWIRLTEGNVPGDVVSYLKRIPLVRPLLAVKTIVEVAWVKARVMQGSYIGGSKAVYDAGEHAAKVLRYYGVLKVPVLLGATAVAAAIIRLVTGLLYRRGGSAEPVERLVLFFAAWWILDMAFVWISPRSYEQYYLPLNASAAILGGYLFRLYRERLAATAHRRYWLTAGGVCFFLMAMMSLPIFIGLTRSPDTGALYKDMPGYPARMRGFAQALETVARRKRGQIDPWERAGDHIRLNSDPDDRIYVWGWVPGIYVRARRMSPAAQAFESEMHVKSPAALGREVAELLASFEKEPPRFIVDTRKRHFPWNRPPLELWPLVSRRSAGSTAGQFLPTDNKSIAAYDRGYQKFLADNIGVDEAERYKAMAPFRRYVMSNYSVVDMFGEHVVFVRKDRRG